MTYDELVAEIEAAAKVGAAENDCGYEDAAHDIAVSYLWSVEDQQLRADLCRCFLGWDPYDDADLYIQNNVNPELAK